MRSRLIALAIAGTCAASPASALGRSSTLTAHRASQLVGQKVVDEYQARYLQGSVTTTCHRLTSRRYRCSYSGLMYSDAGGPNSKQYAVSGDAYATQYTYGVDVRLFNQQTICQIGC